MAQVTEVAKIRRKVLAEISRLAFQGQLAENIRKIPKTVVTEEGPRYRCCVHKERAVLKDRINMALSQKVGTALERAAEQALAGKIADIPVLSVLPEACDKCPIDKFMVTDACRNCLAHNCIASCPRKAIMVVQNRAYIDKTKCVECGLCKRSCSYGAIIEISRPCERACDINAITAGSDRRATIDYEKCVQCGACKISCPFGAISDRSMLVQVIQQIKANKPVHALVAPAVAGQFGVNVKLGQVISALKKIGFSAVEEVAVGADIVTIEETKEFAARMSENENFMTTSCCPAFVGMIDKHYPEIRSKVSTTVSPMVASGTVVKQQSPDAITVFIGPCIAKKVEALQYPNLIDYVLTFEELASMFVGAGINIAELEAANNEAAASSDGQTFAKAGGVLAAVVNAAKELAPDTVLKAQRCEGLLNCKQALMGIQQGKTEANFFEGMACVGGCVGGPGTLNDSRLTTKLVETQAASAPIKTSPENTFAVEEIAKGHHLHRHLDRV